MDTMEVAEDILQLPPGLFKGDSVFVRDVQIQAQPGPDAWGRAKPQPVIVSIRIFQSVEQAGSSDEIEHTLDYRTIHKIIRNFDYSTDESRDAYDSLIHFSQRLVGEVIDSHREAKLLIDLRFPKAMLHSEGLVIRYGRGGGTQDGSFPYTKMALAVRELTIPCIIGIGDHERVLKQPVVVDFAVKSEFRTDERRKNLPEFFSSIYKDFAESEFMTLEALVTAIAKHLIVDLGSSEAAVCARKPSVFSMAAGPGVQIYRAREFFTPKP